MKDSFYSSSRIALGRSEPIRRANTAGLSWPLAQKLDERTLEGRLFPATAVSARDERPIPDWTHVYAERRRNRRHPRAAVAGSTKPSTPRGSSTASSANATGRRRELRSGYALPAFPAPEVPNEILPPRTTSSPWPRWQCFAPPFGLDSLRR